MEKRLAKLSEKPWRNVNFQFHEIFTLFSFTCWYSLNIVLSSSDGGAFFPGNGNGSATGSPNSPSGNGNNGGLPPNNANHVQNLANQTELQQTPVMPTYQVNTLWKFKIS